MTEGPRQANADGNPITPPCGSRAAHHNPRPSGATNAMPPAPGRPVAGTIQPSHSGTAEPLLEHVAHSEFASVAPHAGQGSSCAPYLPDSGAAASIDATSGARRATVTASVRAVRAARCTAASAATGAASATVLTKYPRPRPGAASAVRRGASGATPAKSMISDCASPRPAQISAAKWLGPSTGTRLTSPSISISTVGTTPSATACSTRGSAWSSRCSMSYSSSPCGPAHTPGVSSSKAVYPRLVWVLPDPIPRWLARRVIEHHPTGT